MESKTLEIRDRMTFIAVLATKAGPRNEDERYLWSRSGYGRETKSQESYILLTRLTDCQTSFDPNAWGNRTMSTAHRWIGSHWKEIENGQVVDVEYILGETDHPKVTERLNSASAFQNA